MRTWLLGIIAILAAGGVSAGIGAYTRLGVIADRVERLERDHARDDSQDSQLRKQWQYLGTLELWLNRTRAHMNPPLDPVDHPVFP